MRSPWRLCFATTCAVGLVLGCAPPQAPSATENASDARPFLIGAALQSVSASGQFITETPPPQPYQQITVEQAREQAAAAVRTFGPDLRRSLERKRGTAIDFSELVPGRTFYGRSAYEQTLPTDFHAGYRKGFGPFYLVLFTDKGVPVLNVAVSAYNTDVEITNGRVTEYAPFHGAEFYFAAVKVGETPMTPERAAQIAAGFAGMRVAAAPWYELPGIQLIPQAGTWRVPLEHAVRVREARTGRELDVGEIAIGQDGVPTQAIPALGTLPGDRRVDRFSGRGAELRLRPTAAKSFVPLTRAGRN